MLRVGSDPCSHAGAIELAGQIREFWRNAGHPEVKVWLVEEQKFAGQAITFSIRSNIEPTWQSSLKSARSKCGSL